MILLKVITLVQGLLLATHCELGARDPQEEDVRERPHLPHWDYATPPSTLQSPDYVPEQGHADGSHEHPPPGLLEDTVDVSPEAGTQGTPAHTGYKLSTRPVYREKQKILTALRWRCCPGHGGKNCEEIVTSNHDSEDELSSRLHPADPALLHTGPKTLTHNQHSEQNDHHDDNSPVYEFPNSGQNQTEEPIYDHPDSPHKHYGEGDPSTVSEERRGPLPEALDPNPGILSAIMLHLQPVLDNFNQTLERLSEDMRVLQRDMAQLRLSHEPETEPDLLGGEVGGQQQEEDKLAKSFRQLEDLRWELVLQGDKMEQNLHAQQVMLQYNLTNFKADVDIKIKRNQKTLQTNLLSLNSSLSEVKQKQEQLKTELQSVWEEVRMPLSEGQPQDDTAIWEAIARLDNKVMNNTVTLSALGEGQDRIADNIDHLQKGWKTLDERIHNNNRRSEDRYIEAFLEVDGAKEAVQKNIHDLATNITILQKLLQETEDDMDYLYKEFYNNMSSSSGCDCKVLSTSVSQLKQTLANVTVLANENRLALDNAAEERLASWENGDWGPSVDDLKLGLLNVQNSLAFEQSKSRVLQQNVSSLHISLLGSQLDIEALQDLDRMKVTEIKYLSSSFSSLLKDVLRHAEVLEILLGEEVLEFMDWSPEDQEGQSLSALKDTIKDMQEQINGHSRSLASMLNSAPPDTVGDEPLVIADWTSVGVEQGQGDQKFDLYSKEASDYTGTNMFALEKTVEQLRAQVVRLEEQQYISCCNCTKGATPRGVEARLHTELTAVRKSLEDHLRIFSSLFSNTEHMLGSKTTLDLDRLSSLMNRKEAKQKRKREKKRADKRGEEHGDHVNLHRKRDASLETAVFSQLPDSLFMFLASSQDGANTPGTVVFETVTLNRGQTYSPKTGKFRAPSSGVYLFVLTLDFGPGPSLAHLKRGEEVVASLHQGQRRLAGPATRVCLLRLEQGEELQLEIVRGSLEHSNPQDNTFAGLLLLQTT